MTSKRVLNKVDPSGADHVADTADSIADLWKNILGIASNVAGTNTVTFDVPLETGLTSLVAGMTLLIKPAVTNTGPVTLEISGTGTGAKALETAGGEALGGGEFVAGRAYLVAFWDDDAYRIIGSAGAGSGALFPYSNVEIFGASGTWTAPHNCYAVFYAIGGGGSGGARDGAPSAASGGGAGAFCRKAVSGIASGDAATIVIGAGGAAVTADSAGNSGGTTTVTSSDFTINLSAGGGSGGAIGASSAAAAAGGTGTGGDVNYQGGNSGSATGNYGASGGGAVNFFDSQPNTTGSLSFASSAGATASPFSINLPPFSLGGVGGDNFYIFTASTATYSAGNGGAFCGGGGAAAAGDGPGTASLIAGNGGLGAGGGGAANGDGSGGSFITGSAGGDGLVVVWYTDDIA